MRMITRNLGKLCEVAESNFITPASVLIRSQCEVILISTSFVKIKQSKGLNYVPTAL